MSTAMKTALCATALMAGSALAAPKEYVWTGAENACWTNAANWTVGGQVATDVPGLSFDSAGSSVDNLDTRAVFGAAGSSRTTINMLGLFYVSNIVVKAGAPAYTFGTEKAKERDLSLSPYGGRFVVEAGAAAPTIRFLCNWVLTDAGNYTYGDEREPRIENYASSALTINSCEYAHSSANGGQIIASTISYGFGGSGDILIRSRNSYYEQKKLCYHLYQTGNARLTFDCAMTSASSCDYVINEFAVGNLTVGAGVHKFVEAPGVTGTVEFTEKAIMPFRLNKNYLTAVGEGAALRLIGAGQVQFKSMNGNGNSAGFLYASAPIISAKGGRVEIECDVSSYNDDAKAGLYSGDGDGGGTIAVRGANGLTGALDMIAAVGGASYELRSAADLGNMSVVRFGNGSDLRHIGTAPCALETPLVITNRSPWFDYMGKRDITPKGGITQSGTGPLTVSSDLDISGTASAELTLDNDVTAMATWSGSLNNAADGSVLSVVKTGSGVWTLAAANAYSGATTVSAGTLELAAEGSIANSAVTVADGAVLSVAGSQEVAGLAFNGTAKIVLAAGALLDAASVTPDNKAMLQVWAGDGAKIRFGGVTGSVPAWLSLRNDRGTEVTAQIGDDGYISENATVWTGAATGLWTDAANWTAGVPATDKRAIVNTSGAVLEVPAEPAAPDAGTVTLKAGTLDVKGTLVAAPELGGGAIAVNGGTLDVKNGWGIVGTGSVTVDSANGGRIAVMKADVAYTRFGTGEATGLLEMTVGSSAFNGGSTGYVDFGCDQKGTFQLTVQDSGQNSIFTGTSPRRTRFAVGKGLSEATLNGGSLQGMNWGVHIAAGTAADSAVTGRVHLVGGRLYASSGYVDSSWGGVAIGTCTAASTPAAVRGEVWLDEGGLIQVNGISPFGLGLGGAEGFVRQTGGAFSMSTSGNTAAAVLGYGSGTGEYIISNGMFSVNRPLFVGGCLRTDLELKTGSTATTYVLYNEGANHPAGRGEATGRFFARGGSVNVTAEKGIVIGADGKGRLEIGPTGVVTSTVVAVSNNVEGVLAYELGANGSGSLVASKLVLADGAKLEIDATNLAADPKRMLHLATADEVEGVFDAADVTLTYPPERADLFKGASIVTSRGEEKGLWLKLAPKGLVLIFR